MSAVSIPRVYQGTLRKRIAEVFGSSCQDPGRNLLAPCFWIGAVAENDTICRLTEQEEQEEEEEEEQKPRHRRQHRRLLPQEDDNSDRRVEQHSTRSSNESKSTALQ